MMTKSSLDPEPAGPPNGRQPPSDIRALLSQAVAFHRAGQLDEAERLYRSVLELQPKNFDGLHLLGVIQYQRGEPAEAVRRFDQAIAIVPNSADAHSNRGNALLALKRFEQALASYDQALVLKPNSVDVLVSRANAMQELGRFAEALTSCDRAIAIKSDHAGASYNRGNALAALNRPDEAYAAYSRAIVLKPDYAEAFNNRGAALQEIGQCEQALDDFDRAIALRPVYAQAFNNRGLTLAELKRSDEAVASFDQAIALDPMYAGAYNNRGTTFQELGNPGQALQDFDRAIAIDPHYADAHYNRATTLQGLQRLEEAVAAYDRALAINPEQQLLQGARLHAKMHLCDWRDFDRDCARLLTAIESRKCVSHPFALLPMPSTPAQQLTCAALYAAITCKDEPAPRRGGKRPGHDRIRLAYLSADFHDHATAHLMAGMFESHDRSRFETTAISFGPTRASAMRERLMHAFDRFIDARAKNDQKAADLIRGLEIDIAIDLKGFTQDARPAILANRPAPVQVSYLGYPGTMGTRFIDYLIADRFVIPDDQAAAYAEKVVHLPGSYQVNDASRRISTTIPSRTAVGLPNEAFVFCCFNNSYKITPDLFDIWMRLLRGVDGSVLWLLAGNPCAPDNLRREAEQRGVSAGRLIFAARTNPEDHLARHQLADIFLDTHHCNAHTTASDALWAELPVLTCAGATFASRVAGSLLHAVGLAELVTHTLLDYEALALKLARDPSALAGLKQKLARNRGSSSLFDTVRTARHLEAAYTEMAERQRRGEAPQAFAVAAH
jgi:protein O-GlcNAc transferase